MPGSDNATFYADLAAMPSFDVAMDTLTHVDLPDDWWIVIADVVNSTEAIAQGAYKKVNTVGVACIAAIANIDRNLSLPFIFGGDGATFAIPDSLRQAVIVALRGTQRLARDSFGLGLRAGLVRVSDLRRDDFWVKVARVALSPLVSQAMFSGRGWEEAERRVKSGKDSGAVMVDPDAGPAEASFEGFECRWQNIPSFRDHKLSVIVVAMSPEPAINQATYQRVLRVIAEVFGDLGAHHSLRADQLKLSFAPMTFAGETMVRVQGGWWQKMRYMLSMLLENIAGWWIFRRGGDTPRVPWSRYRDDLVNNTDYRKFDGALRMVVDASATQTRELQARLTTEQTAGMLVWGIHQSSEALITCLIESHAGKHIHFVDGSDGGYALAAKQMKAQLRSLRPLAGSKMCEKFSIPR